MLKPTGIIGVMCVEVCLNYWCDVCRSLPELLVSCVLKSTRIIGVMCVEICLCVLCVLKSSRIIGVMCVEVFQNYWCDVC